MNRVCTGLLLAALAGAQQTYHVAGTVTDSRSGQPLRDALVHILQVGEPPVAVLTDAAGRFFAGGLPAGNFQLRAEKNGFDDAAPGTQARITLGPSRDSLNLALLRLGVINGQVTDAAGDAVPYASVRAIGVRIEDGRKIYREERTVAADDEGRYRIWNLRAGEYYVVAAGRAGGTVSIVGPENSAMGGQEAFAPTYYPAAVDRASAMPIALGVGEEFTADLRVRLQPAYRVRGAIRGAAPYQPVQVQLARGEGEESAVRVVVNAATGRFDALDVVPGRYVLRVTQRNGERDVRGEREVQVGDGNVDGVVLDLLPGVTVKGVVRAPAESEEVARTLASGRDNIAMVSLIGAQAYRSGTAGANGEFSIEGVPADRYRVRIQAFTGYVASATAGTLDLLREELTIAPGVAPPEIEVDVRAGGGEIAWITASAEGQVLLVPQVGRDVQQSRAIGQQLRFTRLAPGRYTLYWVKDASGIEYRNPETMRTLRGVTVEVAEGTTTTVELKEMAQ